MNKRIKKKQAKRWIDSHTFYVSVITDWFIRSDYFKSNTEKYKGLSIYDIIEQMPRDDFDKLIDSITDGYPFHDQPVFKKTLYAMRNLYGYRSTLIVEAIFTERYVKYNHDIDITIDVLQNEKNPKLIKSMNGFNNLYFMVFDIKKGIAIGDIDLNSKDFQIEFTKYSGNPDKIFTVDDYIVLSERRNQFLSEPSFFYCMIPISGNRDVILIRTKKT